MSRRVNRAMFLDIDGVLAPFGRPCPALDAEALDRLRALSRHALIVLTSSWPAEVAREYGVPFDDALYEHPHVSRWVSLDDDLQAKALEGLPVDDPVRHLLATPERFLLTDWAHLWPFEETRGSGLTAQVYDRAVAILRPELGAAIRECREALARLLRKRGAGGDAERADLLRY